MVARDDSPRRRRPRGCGGSLRGGASALAVCVLVACGGGQPRLEDTVTDQEVAEFIDETTPRLDEDLFAEAVEKGQQNATECGASAGAEPGEGQVTLTIDGATGRVADVSVLAPAWSADATVAKCLKNAFVNLIINRFEGTEDRTVDVTIPAEKEEEAP